MTINQRTRILLTASMLIVLTYVMLHKPAIQVKRIVMPSGYFCITYVDVLGNESECVPQPITKLPMELHPECPNVCSGYQVYVSPQ
jgi:hypothetical protein